MDSFHCSKCDKEIEPFVFPVYRHALGNQNFRVVVWTGKCMQMTLMSIHPRCEIGFEVHEHLDQMIRVEGGCAIVKFGHPESCHGKTYKLNVGDCVFVPAGTWHNIINTGRDSLKLSSIYSPPNHPVGLIQQDKPNEY